MKCKTQKVQVLTIYYLDMTHNTHMNLMQIIHSRACPKLNLIPMRSHMHLGAFKSF
jgi:hypothetical protein